MREGVQFAMQAFNLLDEEQRRTIGQELIEFLRFQEAIALERLEQMDREAEDRVNEIREGIKEGLFEGIEPFQEGAAEFKQAVDKMDMSVNKFGQFAEQLNAMVGVLDGAAQQILTAARTPQRVVIDTGGQEVGIA